jgi:2-oxoisovalerate dehydrogenase E1 component
VTYGNGYYYSRQAASELSKKFKVKILDLRWLSDVNVSKIVSEIGHCKNVLVVEECRKTGSFSEFIVSAFVENFNQLPKIKIVAADDCFIPLGKASAAGLPKKEEILKAAESMLSGSHSNFERVQQL